ncbi:MAG: gliding motility-associated C-terminal domain-containing protein [Lewinellaceae bacterium]|nr:gliding motility-associated C-terminal domain-containing protein [Lewinellaceae bacterium]
MYLLQGTPVTLDGEPLFGAFLIAVYEASPGEWVCAGESQWLGFNTIFQVRGMDSTYPGYAEGDELKFYIQLESGCVVTEVEVTFETTPAYPGGGIYSNNGKNLISSINATTPSLAINANIGADTCVANTGSILVEPTVPGTAFFYQWYDGSTGNTIEDLPAGDDYLLTVTDEYSCSQVVSFSIPSAPCPLLLCDATCNGHPNTAAGCAPFQVDFLDASTAGAGIESWSWDFGDGNSSTEPSPTHTYEQSGTYTATLTVSDGYQTDSKSFEIMVYDEPIALPLLENDICQPNRVSLSAESPNEIASWSWVFDGGQQLNEQAGTLEFDNYNTAVNGTLYIVDFRGCNNQLEVEVEIPEPYDLSIGDVALAAPRCREANGSIALTASGGLPPYAYSWAHDDMLADNTATNLSPGAYAFTLTDANGCTESRSFSLEDNTEVPEPVLGGDASFCENEIEVLEAGIAGGNFQWFLDGQLIEGAADPALVPVQSGAYQVQVTNGDGCTGSDEAMVTLLSTPALDLPPDTTLCPSDSLLLSAACPGCTYAWNDGQTEAQRYAFAGGSYALTATNAEGCSAADTISLGALPQPAVALGPDAELCAGETLLLEGPAGEGYTYQWSTGAATRQITLSQSGMYALSVTNAEGCTGTDALDARYLPEIAAEIFASADEACPGDTIALMGIEADWIEWIDTSRTLLPVMDAEALAAPIHTTTYGLIAANACSGDTAFYTIKVMPRLADAGPDTCIARGQSAELRASGAVAYHWLEEPFSLSGYDIPNPVASPDSSTWYQVAMEDSLGCRYVDSTFVEVIVLEEVEIPLVAVITPNGDGQNDRLVFPLLTKFRLYKLTVFNRWGKTVYRSLNYQNDWEGTHKGKPLPAGAYFYVLEMGDRTLKSSLTIIRE